MALRVAVLASGRGSNLAHLLRACRRGWIDGDVTVVATDRPGCGAVDVARKAGVPAIVELPPEAGESRPAYDARLLEVLDAEGPDLVVLAGFMRILGADVCKAFEHAIVNIHPALLPSFRGARGVRDALAAGAKVAGCTTHFVTADLDGGPIILQAAVAVRREDTPETLGARVLELEHQVLPRTVGLIAEGRVAVAGSRVAIADGPSWLARPDFEPVPGALYPEGF